MKFTWTSEDVIVVIQETVDFGTPSPAPWMHRVTIWEIDRPIWHRVDVATLKAA